MCPISSSGTHSLTFHLCQVSCACFSERLSSVEVTILWTLHTVSQVFIIMAACVLISSDGLPHYFQHHVGFVGETNTVTGEIHTAWSGLYLILNTAAAEFLEPLHVV